ncbi:unnamed protein product, partial [Bubo scandiacus]
MDVLEVHQAAWEVVKGKSALLCHQARQKEEDVLSTFNKKLCTCQISSAAHGMRHRRYLL